MANIIDSFFVALGFEVHTEKIDEFKKKTEELRESVLKVGAIATGAAVGIGLLVEKVASSMGELYSFAELNDVSAKSVAAFGKIAQENDSSLEGMKSTIQSLNSKIGEAALGVGRGAVLFEKLGLSAKNADGSVKSVDDLLGDVADKMQGLTRQQQIAMAEKLGIDPQFVKVLEKGSANLKQLREEAELMNPFSERDYQLADEVDKLFIKAKGSLGYFTKMIGVSLLPTVKEVLKQYLEWFKASRKATSNIFVQAVQAITSAIGTLWDWVVRLVGGLKHVYDWLVQFKIVTYLAAGALAVFISLKAYDFVLQLGAAIKMLTLRVATFNATALVIPAIIGAIILALGLLIDDYVNWKEGNDSVIGSLAEKFPWLLDVIHTIEAAVGAFTDFWLRQWSTLEGPMTQLVGAVWELVKVVVANLWPVIKMVFTGWAYVLAAVVPLIASVVAWLAEKLVGAIEWVVGALTWIVEAATTVFSGVVAVVQFAISAIVAYFTWWWDTVSAAYSFVVGLIGKVVDAVFGGVRGAVQWALDLVESAKQKVMGFVDMVAGAIGKVAQLLGLTNDASNVKVAVNSSDSAASSAAGNSVNRTGGVIGSAGSNVNTSSQSNVTNTTQVTAPITVVSPDPAKAGESVKQELDRLNKQATRNGQTAVAL